MKSKNLVLTLIVLFAGLLFIYSCQKDNGNTQNQLLNVYLTDNPVQLNAVNIDIISIEAKVDSTDQRGNDHHGDHDMDGDDHGHHADEFGYWTTLNFVPGVYNVLQLRNGIDSMIASANINGTVRKLRITIGTNNTVIDTNGVTHTLTLSDPTQNILYIHLQDQHRSHHHGNNATAVWVDFDLGHSIQLVNGQYILTPHIRPFCDDNFGEIEGNVMPDSAHAFVMAYNATDTAYAMPHRGGHFKIRGLNPGTYNVLIDGQAPFQDTLIQNISVDLSHEVELGNIILHQ